MSDETPKQLAERRLIEMTSKALDVIDQSLSAPQPMRNQQARSGDAWRVIDAVLALAARDEADSGAKPVAKVDAAEAVAEIRRRAAAVGAKQ